MEEQRILVSIDAQLDTRLGTIAKHCPGAVLTIMENGYWDRQSDDFETLSGGMFSNEDYAKWWKERTHESLVKASMTNGVYVLAGMMLELERQAVEGVRIGNITVTINMAPYEVGKNVAEAIVSAIRTKLPPAVNVTWTNHSLEEMTPALLDRLYDGAMIYDFNEWINAHGPSLMNRQIPQFTFYVPALLLPGNTLDSPVYKTKNGTVDPFKYMRIHEFGKYQLDFLPPSVFSVINPINLLHGPSA